MVFRAEDYLYSSAADYAGEKGILDNVADIRQICKCHAIQSRGSRGASEGDLASQTTIVDWKFRFAHDLFVSYDIQKLIILAI